MFSATSRAVQQADGLHHIGAGVTKGGQRANKLFIGGEDANLLLSPEKYVAIL